MQLSSKSHAAFVAVILALAVAMCPGFAHAQGIDVANRPVADIKVEGLKQVPLQLVTNQIRLNKGEAYDAKTVEEDIVRITHLGQFSSVRANVIAQADGTVVVIYKLNEQTLLADVQVVGNKALTDQELLNLVKLSGGDPADPFLMDRGVQEIKRAYEKAGYFVTDVAIDREMLNESGVLLYRVREGPRPRIRGLKTEGNTTFSEDELKSKIRSKKYILIFRKGELNREQLDADAARIRDFYRERGFLDCEVGRRIDLSDDQKDAIIVFVVAEGARYTVEKIAVEGNKLFDTAQIIEALDLKVGDVFSNDRLKKSQELLQDLYGKIGFIDARVQIDRLFHENEARVDVSVKIDEGNAYTVGKVTVKGNQLTQDKVVMRQFRGIFPGERYDRTGMKLTEQRLKESSLFTDAHVTVLGERDDEIRDAVVELKERNTGSLSFGAGISSDAGVIGAIDLVQRNFDIADAPDSASEMFTGKAFRGAGQYFAISLQPGLQTSTYSVTFKEPYLLESDYFMDTRLFYFQRDREKYNEQRVGANLGFGHNFGDVWAASIRGRGELVTIDDIEGDAPFDVYDVGGTNLITAIGPSVVRNTTDSRIFPTRGSRMEIGVSRVGALGGDFDYTSATFEYNKYWTVDEDFFGRRTVFSIRNQIGYIFDGEAPLFERFYAGGHRTFRGFAFRGISPRGIRNTRGFDGKYNTADDGRVHGDYPVGGDFLFLTSFEYNIPVYQDIIRWVFFSDTGTVNENFSFHNFRVSVGTGLRIKIPFLGQAPFALDFAYPLIKDPEDDIRFFSFDLAVPF